MCIPEQVSMRPEQLTTHGGDTKAILILAFLRTEEKALHKGLQECALSHNTSRLAM